MPDSETNTFWQANRPILTFYGDDFTGSTDVLESLSMAGVPTMLFLQPPSADDIAHYGAPAAIGVAGTSRSRSPQWMDETLPDIFKALKALGAPICHYKTCSTFDSSPAVGNIGRAAEIGRAVFGRAVPCVVGVVRLRRYVMFANLFAAATVSGDDEVFRIDRHPTMRRHPVTPMLEADLRLHLAAQTAMPIAGFDFTRMLADGAEAALADLMRSAGLIVFDTFDNATTGATGRLLAMLASEAPLFVVGSSGVEYALAEHLASTGALPLAPAPRQATATDRLLAVCGSCSPVTSGQIDWAAANGFSVLDLDTVDLITGDEEAASQAVVDAVARAFSEAAGVVINTARGPADPRLDLTRKALKAAGLADADSSRVLGTKLGRITREVIARTGLKRVAFAGGDSSSHAVSALGADALGIAGLMIPGAPLCRVHARDAVVDGLEITLKGGQVGKPNYFAQVMQGH